MNLQKGTPYLKSQLELIFQEYEKSTQHLLNLRNLNNTQKSIIKIFCKSKHTSTCSFKMIFLRKTYKAHSYYLFREDSSCLEHSHSKIPQKDWQSSFCKRDFKILEAPIREYLEQNNSEEETLKPKKILNILKNEGKFTNSLNEGFKLFPTDFKKKFDNTVNKIKNRMRSSRLSTNVFMENETVRVVNYSQNENETSLESFKIEDRGIILKEEEEEKEYVIFHAMEFY